MTFTMAAYWTISSAKKPQKPDKTIRRNKNYKLAGGEVKKHRMGVQGDEGVWEHGSQLMLLVNCVEAQPHSKKTTSTDLL